MSKEPKPKAPASFQEKLDQLAKDRKQKEEYSFPVKQAVVVHILSVKLQSFTKGTRSWESNVYRALLCHLDDQGNIDSEEPIFFFGNTVLDGSLAPEKTYMVYYLGKPADYHDYAVYETTERELQQLAQAEK